MEPEELEAHTERMRKEARNAYACRMAFADFPPGEHQHIFLRSIRNVLNTELALFTFAELIDGLPTFDDCFNRRIPGIYGYHIMEDIGHEELCDGVMDKAREMTSQFDPSILKFSPKAFREYLESTPGTKSFNLRLIELVATALHQLGAEVYKLDLRLHKGDIDAVVNYVMPESECPDGFIPMEPRKTIFSHAWYLDDDVYPDGVADVVGYWTEDRILGGVAVFDRKPSTGEPPNVYWHSDRRKITYRLYQLLDSQQDALIAFLTSDPEQESPPQCPLPILGGRDNRERVSGEVSITEHRVYRDEWERKAISDEEMQIMQRRPQSEVDYPWARDMVFGINAQLGTPLPEGASAEAHAEYEAAKARVEARDIRPTTPLPDILPAFEDQSTRPPGPRTPSPSLSEGSGALLDAEMKGDEGRRGEEKS